MPPDLQSSGESSIPGTSTPAYIHLAPGSELPALGIHPFRAIVVIEQSVARAWQSLVSAWLVRSGCLYMMAWGTDCSSWDDSVDFANLERFGSAVIPDDHLVMTTWHESESLAEVFRFEKCAAHHPTVRLEQVLILHIASEAARDSLLRTYDAA